MKPIVTVLLLTLFSAKLFGAIETLEERSVKEHWTFKWKHLEMPFATGLSKDVLDAIKQFPVRSLNTESLPKAFKLENLTSITNQGQCGSCWAFASIGAIENFPGNKNGIRLSQQFLVDCDGQSVGCGGGYFTALDESEKGVPLNSDYPYRARNGRCQSKPAAAKVNSWAMVSRNPTTDEIKAALIKYNAPIVVTITADNAFMSYQSGVYNACRSGQTNHMVDVVGFDDDKAAWLVRNSWGESWGDNGYIWMKYTDSRGRKCNDVGEEAAYLESVTFLK